MLDEEPPSCGERHTDWARVARCLTGVFKLRLMQRLPSAGRHSRRALAGRRARWAATAAEEMPEPNWSYLAVPGYATRLTAGMQESHAPGRDD